MHPHLNPSSPEFPEEQLTPNDLLSINALVVQLEFEKNLHRENSYFLLETEFKVSNVKQIRRSDFNRAVALLVDLQEMCVFH